MKRIARLFCTSLSLLLLLCGCSQPFTPEFGEMSAKYANLLEQYQINMIFQNIIRAAHTRPLSFLDIPNINGSGSVELTPSVSGLFNGGGLPANAYGLNILGGLSTLTPSAGIAVGKSFNFSQSSLDNAVFWKGFLSDLPPETIKYFVHNHLPKELIFSLVVDEIQIQSPDGSIKSYVNNPMLDSHPQFQQQMYQLIRDGLTPQYVVASQKVGGVMTEAMLRKMYGDNYRQALSRDHLDLIAVNTSGGKSFQIISTQPGFKLCLKNNRFANFDKDISRNDYCQVSPLSEDEVQVSSNRGTRLFLKMRSTSTIYTYLGEVVNAQLQDKPYMVSIPPVEKENDLDARNSNRYALLVVKQNAQLDRPFAYLNDVLEGDTYAIPSKDNGYSKLTIKTLTEFQTLQKIPGSVMPSPAVLIR